MANAASIRKAGGHVELTIFGEQGHGSMSTTAYSDENTMVLDFLNRHLRK